jgi:hypothetical protein
MVEAMFSFKLFWKMTADWASGIALPGIEGRTRYAIRIELPLVRNQKIFILAI